MYKVILIEDDEMTRNIELKNVETGTIDECFDDSALIGNECFDFMELARNITLKLNYLEM